MAFQLDLSPHALSFAGSLSQPERERLSRCWDLLAANPYVDGMTKISVPTPPAVHLFRLVHFCAGFKTIYEIDGTTVVVYNANWHRPYYP